MVRYTCRTCTSYHFQEKQLFLQLSLCCSLLAFRDTYERKEVMEFPQASVLHDTKMLIHSADNDSTLKIYRFPPLSNIFDQHTNGQCCI